MATPSLDLFGSLSPMEAAVLWFSASPFNDSVQYQATLNVRSDNVQVTFPVPQQGRAVLRVAIPKITLILAAALVDRYVRNRGYIYDQSVRDEIRSFVDKLFTSRGKHVLSVSDTDEMMTDFIREVIGPAEATLEKAEISIAQLRSECERSLKKLEDLGLVEDPPWKKIGLGSLVILLGITPMDFSVRTERGEHLVRTIQVEAPLWAYRNVSAPDEDSWQLKIRAVDFAGETLRKLADQYIQTWDRTQQSRLNSRPPGADVKLDSEP